MTARGAALGVLAGLLLAAEVAAQGLAEVEKLLDQSLRLEAKRARPILQRALAIIEEEKLSAGERDRLSAKLARAVQRLTHSPADLQALLGEKATWAVARQVSYRRYREQWLCETPVRLLATFDCPQGHKPVLMGIQPLPVP